MQIRNRVLRDILHVQEVVTPLCIVTYYIKWVDTSWTYSIVSLHIHIDALVMPKTCQIFSALCQQYTKCYIYAKKPQKWAISTHFYAAMGDYGMQNPVLWIHIFLLPWIRIIFFPSIKLNISSRSLFLHLCTLNWRIHRGRRRCYTPPPPLKKQNLIRRREKKGK